MKTLLDIIIVNWNSGDQLRECLRSIASVDCNSFALNKVTVVDNDSSDGSADNLDSAEVPVELIRNRNNQGFAKACNQGAAGSSADFLLFLNPDTRLQFDSLSKPISFMNKESNRDIGIIGIQLVSDENEINRSCSCFPVPINYLFKILGMGFIFPRRPFTHFMTDWDHKNSMVVDHVIGAFFMVRRSLFELLEGFDTKFFVYLEDMDFSYRARQAGWKSYYLAETQAVHRGGGTSEQVKATRLFYSLRSRLIYSFKHFNLITGIAIAIGTLCIEPWTRIIHAIYKKSLTQARDTIMGYALLWRSLLSPRN